MAVEPTSPANGKTRVTDATRIPMSSGQQKLSVPEIPGYVQHWMKGTPERIQQALQGGYEFVEESATRQINLGIGGDAKKSGNTDLGTRVSALAGGDETTPDGQPMRLYLMKIRQEWYDEDQRIQASRSESFREALQKGQDMTANPGDSSNRYVGKNTTMFDPKPIRRI